MTPAVDVLKGQVTLRRARRADVEQIAALVGVWAAEDVLLPRTPAQVAAAVDDYVVAADGRGRVLACGAVREYAPSLAELVSLAVTSEAHGRGLGRLVVASVERLAVARGHVALFAHTLAPEFFAAVGYACVERDLFPEKDARPHTWCVVRDLVSLDERLAAAA